MKPIDGDRLLSDLFQKAVRSEDIGDTVVRYTDLLEAVRSSEEVTTRESRPFSAVKSRDYNGYIRCSHCNTRILDSNSNYCNGCGRKFI